MVSTFSCHFYQEVLSLEHFGLLRTCVPLLLRDQRFFYLMTSRAFLLSTAWGEQRNELPWKGNCTSLSHGFLLSYIKVHKLLTETYKILPIVSSRSVASLEIVEMYKINEKKTAGKEILGHAFKSFLTKKKVSFRGWEQFQCSVFCIIGFVGYNMCISGANELIEEGLILGSKKCKYIEWYGILPDTMFPRK